DKGLKKILKKSVSKGFRLARFCPTSALYKCIKQALYFTQINIGRLLADSEQLQKKETEEICDSGSPQVSKPAKRIRLRRVNFGDDGKNNPLRCRGLNDEEEPALKNYPR
ncbi:MAG: hypothetical protein MUO27_02585, partial [Sedimentisphaerales bacterium]|nr:hypothetical protein [Sedimentisphaerales bacterium]